MKTKIIDLPGNKKGVEVEFSNGDNLIVSDIELGENRKRCFSVNCHFWKDKKKKYEVESVGVNTALPSKVLYARAGLIGIHEIDFDKYWIDESGECIERESKQ